MDNYTFISNLNKYSEIDVMGVESIDIPSPNKEQADIIKLSRFSDDDSIDVTEERMFTGGDLNIVWSIKLEVDESGISKIYPTFKDIYGVISIDENDQFSEDPDDIKDYTVEVNINNLNWDIEYDEASLTKINLLSGLQIGGIDLDFNKQQAIIYFI